MLSAIHFQTFPWAQYTEYLLKELKLLEFLSNLTVYLKVVTALIR